MTMVSPKTIVITSLPARTTVMTSRPLSTMAASLPLAVTEGLGIHGEPKKRKRLTNLSPEERLMRRKLKNRVAAQTARDRKKQRMDELEILLADIEAENKRLQAENQALRRKTGKLAVENNQLKERLGGGSGGVGEMDSLVVESPGSAALNLPQQQDSIQPPVPSHTTPPPPQSPSRLAQMIFTVSLMCYLASWKSYPATLRRTKRAILPKRLQHHQQQSSVHRPPPHLTWWGPRQQNWTPSMN